MVEDKPCEDFSYVVKKSDVHSIASATWRSTSFYLRRGASGSGRILEGLYKESLRISPSSSAGLQLRVVQGVALALALLRL